MCNGGEVWGRCCLWFFDSVDTLKRAALFVSPSPYKSEGALDGLEETKKSREMRDQVVSYWRSRRDYLRFSRPGRYWHTT